MADAPALTGTQLFALDLLRANRGMMRLGSRNTSSPPTIAVTTAQALERRGLVSIEAERVTLVEAT